MVLVIVHSCMFYGTPDSRCSMAARAAHVCNVLCLPFSFRDHIVNRSFSDRLHATEMGDHESFDVDSRVVDAESVIS